MSNDSLIDPSLLKGLSAQEREEALAAAAAARRAEERAERRALERAMAQREAQRRQQEATSGATNSSTGVTPTNTNGNNKVVFVSRKLRAAQKQQQQNDDTKKKGTVPNPTATVTTSSNNNRSNGSSSQQQYDQRHNTTTTWSDSQLASIKQSYLGKRNYQTTQEEQAAAAARLKQQRKDRSKKKILFKFEWDASEDTSQLQEENDQELFLLTKKNNRQAKKKKSMARHKDAVATMDSAMTKPLDEMTSRDWRIFRENYDITVKGGKTPPPLRSFREAPSAEIPSLHPALLDAIQHVLQYREPSPIQRQAIPIGLQKRDLIGVAETGSGKTAAFGIPLCHYLLHLKPSILNRVSTEGPLALVMAPTRELAMQIDAEMSKLLSRQTKSNISTFCVVGGQSIQQQAYRLREGVHVVVGTPGRINDCVEMSYLVLNQCCYIVMDEADRMIDLGFAPQMEQILDAMGGLLKSEDESTTYQQELEDLKHTDDLPRHRLTAMFSATMPPEVERLAKRYLRHPAVVSIGDEDSGKNARITQRIVFLSAPSQKEKALRDLLVGSSHRNQQEKIIVFVNEKKHADGVGRMVERMGRRCVVLHGGKSQEQREENLEIFKRGGVVLVATDVAGRGLDIPNVTHVINYDLPSRSIENYTHRIGRTGRAGKEGLATSFLTDEDTTIMGPLKAYLESTGNRVPDKLARHPAANAGVAGSHINT